ncbi:MAG TPA: tetratricopeptide repeat protein [Pyrinomonadaceae bacterium]
MSSQAFRLLYALGIFSLAVIIPRCASGATRTPPPQQADDEVAVRALVERFFVAYQKEDLEGLMLLWSEKSPDRASGRQSLQRTFDAYEKIEVTGVTVRAIRAAGEQVLVRLVLEMSAVDSKTGQPASGLGKRRRTLRLVKEGGTWKIWKSLSSEEDLASELAAAAGDAQRRALVQAEEELITVELAQALNTQARALQDKSGYAEALSVYRYALNLAIRLGNKRAQAGSLRGIGSVYQAQGNPAQALPYMNESLALTEELGDKGEMAAILVSLGNVYVSKGDYESALNHYRRSLKLAQALENKLRVAVAQAGVARVHMLKGETAEALALFQSSLEVFRELRSQDQVAVTLTRLGDVHRVRGEYEKSLKYFAEALESARSLGLKPLVSSVLFGLGVVHRFRGEYEKSLEYFRESLKQARELNYKKQVSGTLNSMGVIYRSQGDYRLALETLQESLKIAEEMEDKEGVAVALTNIGELHRSQGHHTLALEFYRDSLRLAREMENKRLIAGTLDDIGEVYNSQGDYARARRAYEESLALSREYGYRAEVVGTLHNLGDAYYAEGSYAEALRYYQESLRHARELGYKEKIVIASLGAANAHHSLADYQKAIELANGAAELARQIGLQDFIWAARTVAGKAYRALNKPDEARLSLAEAVALVERLRQQVAGGEQDQQRFFEKRVAPYYEMVDLLVAQGDYAGALGYAERAKGRVLLDLLSDGRVNVTKAMTDAEQRRERSLQGELVSLNTQLYREQLQPQPDGARLAELAGRLQKARLDYESLQTNLYATHPELKVRRGRMEPLDLKDAGELTHASGAALLEYVVTEKRTYLFVVTRNGATKEATALDVYKIEIEQKKLAEMVERYRRRLSLRDWGLEGLSADLYNLLLRPAASQLRKETALIIAPDGPLWELPFQALRSSPDRYVVEDHAVSYAPSLTVLREMMKDRSRRAKDEAGAPTLLAFGNPALSGQPGKLVKSVWRGEELAPLPEAERQVKELGRLYGLKQSKVYTGGEASEGRVKSEAGKYRIVHLAAHAVLNDANPMYSQIILSQVERGTGDEDDGLLEAWEITKLDLNADMVVLSACETGRGRVGAGEGVIGLSWALFVAGSPATVVSQWKVASAGTTELMIEFYRNLRAADTTAARAAAGASVGAKPPSVITKSEALRRAALKLLRSEKYRDPFYWAGFVVVGDAR